MGCVAELEELTRYLAKATRVLTSDELTDAHRIGHVVETVLRHRADLTMRKHDGLPVMQVYMCDGWSAKVSSATVDRHEASVVFRRGHFRHEFLLQRGLRRFRQLNGDTEMCMIVGAPRGLRYGKTSWNVLTSCCEFMGTPRACGHRGISLSIYISDGMLFNK